MIARPRAFTLLPLPLTFVAVFALYFTLLIANDFWEWDIPGLASTLGLYATLAICVIILAPLICFRGTRPLSAHGFVAAAAVFSAYLIFFREFDPSMPFVWAFPYGIFAFACGLIASRLAVQIERDRRHDAQRPRLTKADAELIEGSLRPHILSPPAWRFWVRFGVGSFMLVLCAALAIAGTLASEGLREGYDRTGVPSTLLLILQIAAYGLFIVAVNITQSLLARSATGRLSENRLRPVLYLRTFGADEFGGRGIARSVLFGWQDTPERDLARAIRRIGPMIAIGRPGEILPPIGALRMYAGDDHWVEVFKQLETISSLVVLRAGTTASLMIELKHLVETVSPEKLIIYVPRPDRGSVYSTFVPMSAKVLPASLPSLRHLGEDMFVRFGADWTPELVASHGPSLRDRLRKWMLAGSDAPAVYHALYEIGLVQSAWYEFSLRECINALFWFGLTAQLLVATMQVLVGLLRTVFADRA